MDTDLYDYEVSIPPRVIIYTIFNALVLECVQHHVEPHQGGAAPSE